MYYKVLTLKNGKKGLWSFTCYHPIRYLVGRWTERPTKCGPLAVWDDYAVALDFARRHRCPRIYTCRIIPSQDTQLWDTERRTTWLLPGTILADKVKLVKRIL